MSANEEGWARGKTAHGFGFVEDGFYVLIAVALSIAGAILFGYSIYTFVVDISKLPISDLILDLLDNLLLVFIITELIHTIRAIIDRRVLLAEPFLIVGIVAAIRRLIVVSAEAKELIGTPDFADAMLEVGLLSASALVLTGAVFMLRHTTHSEPLPSEESELSEGK